MIGSPFIYLKKPCVTLRVKCANTNSTFIIINLKLDFQNIPIKLCILVAMSYVDLICIRRVQKVSRVWLTHIPKECSNCLDIDLNDLILLDDELTILSFLIVSFLLFTCNFAES